MFDNDGIVSRERAQIQRLNDENQKLVLINTELKIKLHKLEEHQINEEKNEKILLKQNENNKKCLEEV